jgi:hypothetical protein
MLYKVNFDKFCEKLVALKDGEKFDFATTADEEKNGEVMPDSGLDWYGVTKPNLFDCDRIIIVRCGGNPEYIVTLNGQPSEPHEYIWDDMQVVFKDMFRLNKFQDDLCVYIEHKSDAELIKEILRKYGWWVENTADGFLVSDIGHTISCVIQPSPDGENQTDFFAYSYDNSTDGHLTTFPEGYPDEYEIREAERAAFDDERRYRGND